jgi:hypothetical protein
MTLDLRLSAEAHDLTSVLRALVFGVVKRAACRKCNTHQKRDSGEEKREPMEATAYSL